jgi:hypothetical protein
MGGMALTLSDLIANKELLGFEQQLYWVPPKQAC